MNKNLIISMLIIIPVVLIPGNAKFFRVSHHEFPHNYFQIHVQTNINQFTIKHQQPQEFTKILDSGLDNDMNIEITIPVEQLKMKNKLMQREFYQMIKIDEYPTITIRIPQNEFVKVIRSNSKTLPSIITLAGTTNKTRLYLNSIHLVGDHYFIQGNKNLSLYDYQLTPPEKLGGAIKVNSKVLINFGLSVYLNT